MARRSYGSGSPYARTDAAGVEHWYAKWRSNDRQVKRKVGRKRANGSREGLTRSQAEAELRRLVSETQVQARAGEQLTVREVTDRYLAAAERKGRKLSTRQDMRSTERRHLTPYFGDRSLDSITPEDVSDFIGALEAKGLKPKTVRNVIATYSALFNFAKASRRRWATSNPCESTELPTAEGHAEIRFLTLEEVDALIAHARPGTYQAVDQAMYRVAAMTSLRGGELLALRWRDMDWPAGRTRVRQNYVRGEYGTPKSKRSTRSVPMADEVGGGLKRLFKQSLWHGDEDLVFAHPETGEPLIGPTVTRRFRAALKAAGLDDSHRFHDLRHTFGTRMAAAGVAMRRLQESMGIGRSGRRRSTLTTRRAPARPRWLRLHLRVVVPKRLGPTTIKPGKGAEEEIRPMSDETPDFPPGPRAPEESVPGQTMALSGHKAKYIGSYVEWFEKTSGTKASAVIIEDRGAAYTELTILDPEQHEVDSKMIYPVDNRLPDGELVD